MCIGRARRTTPTAARVHLPAPSPRASARTGRGVPQDLDVSVDLLRAMLDGKADVSTAQDVLKALCNTCARRRGMQ